MPSKTIASILNNESNLRILEKLKVRPYYPRELAAAMNLSEPFIVRRLKAMEEYEIVEGKWETEGGRKVKRYYLKDITMQLGKNGLTVTSADVQVKSEISMEKEILKFLMMLPILLFAFCGVVFDIPVIIVISCLLFCWQLAVNLALYRHYPYKTLITSIILLAVGTTSLITVISMHYIHIHLATNSNTAIGLVFMVIGFAFFMTLIYHVRFSQVEAMEWKNDKRDFISSLDSSSAFVKLFYLPLVLRWKLSEYFGLL